MSTNAYKGSSGTGSEKSSSIRQRYVMHWWDSMGFPPNVFIGNSGGDVLTLSYESPQGHHRVIFDLSKADEYTFRMEMSGDGNGWKTFMNGTYVKQDD